MFPISVSLVNWVSTKEFFSENAIAIASAAIALVALCATIWNGCQTRKHNRLSVKPMLSLARWEGVHGTKIGLVLFNDGLGPAIIRSFTVYVDKKPINRDDNAGGWKNAIRALGMPSTTGWSLPTHTMGVEEEFLVIGADSKDYTQRKDYETDAAKIDKAIPRISIRVVYASIYGESYEQRYPCQD